MLPVRKVLRTTLRSYRRLLRAEQPLLIGQHVLRISDTL